MVKPTEYRQIYFLMSDIPVGKRQEFVERAVLLGCLPESGAPKLVHRLEGSSGLRDCVDIPAPGSVFNSAESESHFNDRIFVVNEPSYTRGSIEPHWSFTKVELKDFLSFNEC